MYLHNTPSLHHTHHLFTMAKSCIRSSRDELLAINLYTYLRIAWSYSSLIRECADPTLSLVLFWQRAILGSLLILYHVIRNRKTFHSIVFVSLYSFRIYIDIKIMLYRDIQIDYNPII